MPASPANSSVTAGWSGSARRSRSRRAAYEHYKALVVAECEQAGTISLARFRDRAEVPRRLAQLLLERFDIDRVTLRVGDERRLRRAAQPG